MKKLFILFAAVTMALTTFSCVKFDDTELKNELSALDARVSDLERQMKTANENISGLSTIVNAIKDKVMVNSITETDDEWTIFFADGKKVTVSKVHSPVIGVKQDTDGTYYWTLDGDWLLDGKGNKMPVSGKDGNDGKDGKNGNDGKDGKDGKDGADGISPQLKIEDGFWFISTDGGSTWTKLGKATGEDGDTLFASISGDSNYVYLTLADGTTLTLVKSDVMDILKKVQSIQYVPDYDDGKITVNSATVKYGSDAVLFDQPTEITYQILPAQYAGTIAEQIRMMYVDHEYSNDILAAVWLLTMKSGEEAEKYLKSIGGPDLRTLLKDYGLTGSIAAWFDVRKVNTRAGGEEEEDVNYGMEILDIVSVDDNTGEITLKVMPVNIASESFSAGGLKPRYDLEIYDQDSNYIKGGSSDAYYADEHYFSGKRGYENFGINTWTVPVWSYEDIMAYQNRSAFAVQLRLYQIQGYDVIGTDESGRTIYTDYENEIASPYTTLYPNILEPIELIPGAYKPGADGTLVDVTYTEEHQYLPYDVLRKDGTSSESGYRSILYGLTPAFVIDGKIVSAKEAYEKGYKLPGMTIEWDGFTFSSDALEDLTVVTGQVYAEVEMNPDKTVEERKAAIGGKVEGRYILTTPFGKQTVKGVVEITDSDGTPGTGPDEPGSGADAGYDFMHLRYYTFNARHSSEITYQYDFDDNDDSVEWWSRMNPSYYTSLPYFVGDGPHYDTRVSFRHALAEYSPGTIDFASLSFNVVDAEDNILDLEDIEAAGLEVKFEFADPELGDRTVPVLGTKYSELWSDNTTFRYVSNEFPFIKIKGRLFRNTETGKTELPTRFTTPRASVKYPSEMLDYSTFAIVPWVPFDNLESDDFRVILDENKVYRIPLGQNLDLMDNRPNGVSYYVIQGGNWVEGNVTEYNAEAGTYSAGAGDIPNGYVSGFSSQEAYQLGDLVYDTDAIMAAIPADFQRFVSIVYSRNGLDFFNEPEEGLAAYLSFDYNSSIRLRGIITIPVHVELPNPWQPTLETDYLIYISGAEGV